MEAEVFAEIKNVEKLLTLLSASNTAPREEDNEEISKLYHQTLAIRPKLIKLIEKYSQKKDDFTQLNEKFIKARRDYEALLESSMSQPPQHNYRPYVMRPAPPPGQQGYAGGVGGSGGGGGGYRLQGQAPPPQDPYYGQAAPPSEHSLYQPSSPPPPPNTNYQPQGPPASPYYVAGAQVPARGPTPQQQQQQHYGAQELATSVYDAPIAPAPQNPPSGRLAGPLGQQQYRQP
ncbi:hypothetical protein E4U41_005258, partial [Claviceps citrina]